MKIIKQILHYFKASSALTLENKIRADIRYVCHSFIYEKLLLIELYLYFNYLFQLLIFRYTQLYIF